MLNIDKHNNILKSILKDIYSNRFLAPILGFKGGATCYLFYDLPRFSSDLDFNLLDLEKEDKVLEELKKIVSKYGKLEDALIKRNTIFFLIRYEKGMMGVKVEVPTRDTDDHYELKQFLGISVLTMVKEDMFAHKFIASTERHTLANRDYFDINFFLEKMWDINENIIFKRTGKSLEQYLKDLIIFIDKNLTQKNILAGLGEVLTESQKDRVRTSLIKDLKFNLDLRLGNIKKQALNR